MGKPKFLGQGEWTAYLDNKEDQIPIIANGKAVAFIPPLHEDAIALSILIPTAVNAYSPMLEALKGLLAEFDSYGIPISRVTDVQALKEKAKAAIALAENKK